MGQKFGTFVFIVVIGLAVQTARAGDRSSAASRHDASSASSTNAHTVVVQSSALVSAPVHAIELDQAASREKVENEGEHRRSVTFFRIKSKLGQVAVQPVVGGVNGAQFQLGF